MPTWDGHLCFPFNKMFLKVFSTLLSKGTVIEGKALILQAVPGPPASLLLGNKGRAPVLLTFQQHFWPHDFYQTIETVQILSQIGNAIPVARTNQVAPGSDLL